MYLRNVSVLVVQRHQEVLDLARFCLEAVEFKKVLSASDGKTAYDLFTKENPDIVITGWELDFHTGIELTKLIRTDARSPNKKVPIIFLTGYSTHERVKNAMFAGIHEYVIKPFNAETLCNKIESVINNPRTFVEAPDYFGPERNYKARSKGMAPTPQHQSEKPAGETVYV